eukprot:CAMPEP_0119503084 /NCGR_PEP_ID=MMETSP1344-20130328/24359_1 /TAXON_ID=236787 /ORGANISM="Florenciella parvula, Strain CCMP2471" /LENGTH=395 /DNA_ID=CAMNT_0007539343 /DNA_START=24 /DNA_END=1211 /DNA_ORIENTATION=-
MENVSWFRVKYKSARFGNDCETPCWTTFYGGDPMFTPYEPVPAWLQPLVDQVTAYTGAPANAMLLRLYFDGADEIAWHTDGRTFLGPTPTIASLSFGAEALFQMRRMRNVWPCAGDNGIDATTPIRDFPVGDGTLLVMKGDTQKHWHHRVPKAKSRRPRININFRYIIPGGTQEAERGQQAYYKYMVHGDHEAPPSFTFNQIIKKRGSLLGMFGKASGPTSKAPSPFPSASASSSTTLPLSDHQAHEEKMAAVGHEAYKEERAVTNEPAKRKRSSEVELASGASETTGPLAVSGLSVAPDAPTGISVGSSAGGSGKFAERASDPASWACTSCSFENHSLMAFCEICETARPAVPSPPVAPQAKRRSMGSAATDQFKGKPGKPSVLQMLNPNRTGP